MRLFTKLAKGSGYNPNRGAGGRFTSGAGGVSSSGVERVPKKFQEAHEVMAGRKLPKRLFENNEGFMLHSSVSAKIAQAKRYLKQVSDPQLVQALNDVHAEAKALYRMDRTAGQAQWKVLNRAIKHARRVHEELYR